MKRVYVLAVFLLLILCVKCSEIGDGGPTSMTPIPLELALPEPANSAPAVAEEDPVEPYVADWQEENDKLVRVQLFNNTGKDEDMGVACYSGPPNDPDIGKLGDSEVRRVLADGDVTVTVDVSCGGIGQCDAFYDLKKARKLRWYNNKFLSGRVTHGAECPEIDSGCGWSWTCIPGWIFSEKLCECVPVSDDPVPCLGCPGCPGCPLEDIKKGGAL